MQAGRICADLRLHRPTCMRSAQRFAKCLPQPDSLLSRIYLGQQYDSRDLASAKALSWPRATSSGFFLGGFNLRKISKNPRKITLII